ncbi:substrate-binding domain-containing protein [Mesorhizobium sp. CGMCC 1.15528]|uniref:Substrate-binding domain-containing protein n=1 Tax=Mesorhizobium zhangyense TaxID=1776730 RepID=A0A7C9VF92_9HYPH|nr:substrate-binding domain-containing protein [Mesorhizobium zhangyense]NGN44667.1 substrate-binding domain-containing protein [Mesorhizobium zhangyense]
MKRLGILFATLCLSVSQVAARDLTSVGIISGPLGNSFYQSLAAGAEAGVKKINPAAKATVTSYEGDLNKEFNLIDSFIAAGVDMIVMVGADPNAVTPVIKKAQNNGIVVVGMDAAANAADANVITDNRQGGEIVCAHLAEKIGGKGNVIIINGPQVQGVIDRVTGCKAALAAKPGIKIVADKEGDSSRDSGFSIMQTLLTQQADIAGVFAISDPMAIGADLAARQLGRDGIHIVGFDGSPEIVDALKKPTSVEASASQNPYALGEKAVQVGFDILNGKPPMEKLVKAPTGLVSRDNVSSYQGWLTQ